MLRWVTYVEGVLDGSCYEDLCYVVFSMDPFLLLICASYTLLVVRRGALIQLFAICNFLLDLVLVMFP